MITRMTDGFVYCKIRKGIYGLPQSGIVAQQLLKDISPKPDISKAR
jgi:hypothetical protein